MRKRCRRKVYATPPVPITFATDRSVKEASQLNAREALDALLAHTATEDHVCTLLSVARYSMLLAVRLKEDGSVSSEADLADATVIVTDGAEAVLAVQQRFNETGKIGCSGPEREQLKALVCGYELLDEVATRKQSSAVLLQLLNTHLAGIGKQAVPL